MQAEEEREMKDGRTDDILAGGKELSGDDVGSVSSHSSGWS